MAIPSKAVLTQNNQKLLSESAHNANKAPATPIRLPTKKPNLRPSHPINSAAGKVALIKPKNCNATGKVTHIADGANFWPISAVTVTNKILPVTSNACPSANPQTVKGNMKCLRRDVIENLKLDYILI